MMHREIKNKQILNKVEKINRTAPEAVCVYLVEGLPLSNMAKLINIYLMSVLSEGDVHSFVWCPICNVQKHFFTDGLTSSFGDAVTDRASMLAYNEQ